VHGDEDRAMRRCSTLAAGGCRSGTPGYLGARADLFEQATIRRRRTFDSGRTPKAGEHAVDAEGARAVDIAGSASIAATVEQAEGERSEGAEGADRRAREAGRGEAPAAKVETKTVEKPRSRNRSCSASAC
jgi:hypothetical protein